MLILVGVSVTVALNGGLFSTAKQAAEGTKQIDAENRETACAFSITPYWTGNDKDLNDNANPDGAMAKAKAYGEALGGKGGLMTAGEVYTLEEAHEEIIYGTEEYYFHYWLGSAYDNEVSIVLGGGFANISFNNYDIDNLYGVRPVVEILKISF